MNTDTAAAAAVTPENTCPNCGRKLPTQGLAGLCPACLLAQGAEPETVHDSATGPASARPEAPSVDEVARLFPQLEILGLLGVGGMGAVFRARQPALDRLVALKLLPAGHEGDSRFAERFNREARALARLSHPNIVAVHEFGQVQGRYYFLMEFVDGTNLRQLERSTRLSPREALQIIPQICDALQYAHDEGIVHRDIKPENVLVDRRGRVKIADFGLARILDSDAGTQRLTVEGQIMGTPQYMAPEQFERPLSVDHRADIYSLGVVFYEMLTGDLPIGRFAPPSRKVEVDVRLDEIVLRALENEPERRYQKVSEVKQRVETVVGGLDGAMERPAPSATPSSEQPAAEPTGPKERYLRWAGIPVIRERDGEREVNLEGALGAVFLTMMVALGAQFLVRFITGGEHSMAGIIHLTALMTALWGIRRTFNQPEETAAAANADGSTARWPYWKDVAMLAGLVAFIIGTHYLKLYVINPALGRPAPQPLARQTATPVPADGTQQATLPGGGMVRLIAVSEPGAAPNQWWRPDGRLLDEAIELHDRVDAGDATGRRRWMLFEVDNLPTGASGLYFEGLPGTQTGSGGSVYRNGRPQHRIQAAVVTWRNEPAQGTVLAGVAIAPWRTIATYEPSEHRMVSGAQPGDPRWNLQIHDTVDTQDGAQVTVLMPVETRNQRFDLAAINRAGTEIPYRRATATGTSGRVDAVWTYTYPGVSLKELKELRFQVRPVHWIRFDGIHLTPASALPEPHHLRFAPDQRITFDELIDFDTAKAAALPLADAGEPPLAGAARDVLWAQEHGYDAYSGSEGLEILNVEFAPVPDTDWDRLTPQAVVDRVHEAPFAPRVLKPTGPGTAGRTFAYKTREGGFGLVRLETVGAPAEAAVIVLRRIER